MRAVASNLVSIVAAHYAATMTRGLARASLTAVWASKKTTKA